MRRRPSYFQNPNLGGASPRETEILAFSLCNDRLGQAAEPRQRIDALRKTHQMWSLLVRDLASEGNRLPQPLKDQLIGLGFWAMTYSTRAIAEALPLQPLIDVHRNLIDGLRAQGTGTGPEPAAAPQAARAALA